MPRVSFLCVRHCYMLKAFCFRFSIHVHPYMPPESLWTRYSKHCLREILPKFLFWCIWLQLWTDWILRSKTQCHDQTKHGPERQMHMHQQLPVRFNLPCVSKKVPTFKFSVTLSNLNKFSKFLHCWKAYEICYKTHTTSPISVYACRYNTMGN